jgi:hypothetical protein
VLGEIASAAKAAARTATFPLALLGLLFAFLLAQDKIDRRDPKLALAPVHKDPDLPFGPGIGPTLAAP